MNPITRRLLRQANETDSYPARPPRCAHRIIRTSRPGWGYAGPCKRNARTSGYCWQHEPKHEEVQS